MLATSLESTLLSERQSFVKWSFLSPKTLKIGNINGENKT